MASLGACSPWRLEALEIRGPGKLDAPEGWRPLEVGGLCRLEAPRGQRLLEVGGFWRSEAAVY